jgi:BASS family bile acid:Na+ symporter
MHRFKPYILPIAIILGITFHHWLEIINGLTPYLIFVILLLTFCSVKLTDLRPSKLEFWIAAIQVVFSLAGYGLILWWTENAILAEGVLIGILCPVASSVSVVSCELGAKRETVVSYTVVGNLLVVFVAPIVFSFIGMQQTMPFWTSFWTILKHISTILALPYLIALCLQWWLPRVNAQLASWKSYALPLWAMALTLTLGRTMDYIVLHYEGNEQNIIWLAVISLVLCVIHFTVGKLLGKHYGDTIAGGQLLAQKNSAVGIWMECLYLHPLCSVVLAFYSIWTNIFNSWQLWYYPRHVTRS